MTWTDDEERKWEADSELDRIRKIEASVERDLEARPDYTGAGQVIAVWLLLMALAEAIWPYGYLPWIVALCCIGGLVEVHRETRERFRIRWEADKEIFATERRISELGFAVRREPVRYILQAKRDE